ncbi:hypothetical protein POM88_031620 [Heracleum sosnowskyi]|uniref:Uncharacterized protein n=1 Tax=Heracleum sosnowskyi TaxID=360622 RepID=A0AAD8HXT5_9APIA|nr:hypothetical protein POM88_031620 [Heracleum sosnowskyi]
MKTVNAEWRLTKEKASLEEDMASSPYVELAVEKSGACKLKQEFNFAFGRYEKAIARLIKKVDKFRFATPNDIIKILNSILAVQFLAADINLKVCMQLGVIKWSISVVVPQGLMSSAVIHTIRNLNPFVSSGGTSERVAKN